MPIFINLLVFKPTYSEVPNNSVEQNNYTEWKDLCQSIRVQTGKTIQSTWKNILGSDCQYHFFFFVLINNI